jgi:hypothetical protein
MAAHRSVMVGTAVSLCGLVRYEVERGEVDLRMYWQQDSILPRSRHELAGRAILGSCQHVLFVDSDMRFPEDALERLLSHGEPFVAANYPTRAAPYVWTAQPADSMPDVTVVGLGLALVDAAIFSKLTPPWFDFVWTDSGNWVGEDAYFCAKAHYEAGVDPVVDNDLAQSVRHIGDLYVGPEHVELHAMLTRVAEPVR